MNDPTKPQWSLRFPEKANDYANSLIFLSSSNKFAERAFVDKFPQSLILLAQETSSSTLLCYCKLFGKKNYYLHTNNVSFSHFFLIFSASIFLHLSID